jgi:hypothetical protein
MTVEIRAVADEPEFERALMQIGQYLGAESAESWGGRFTRVAPLGRMLSAWDGDAMIGGTGAMPFRLSVPGGRSSAAARRSWVSRRRTGDAAC